MGKFVDLHYEFRPMIPDLIRIVQVFVLIVPCLAFSQEVMPLKGKWNTGDARDYVGTWNAAFQKGYLDGAGDGRITGVTDLLGKPGDLPFTLDFTGDDRDEFGLYRPETRELIFFNDFTQRTSIQEIREIANRGDVVITGDWDGDGQDGFALYRPLSRELWFYQDIYAPDPFYQRTIGQSGDILLAGNWDGKGGDELMIWRKSSSALLYFREISSAGFYRQSYVPATTRQVIAGDWNGDGRDEHATFDEKDSDKYEFLLTSEDGENTIVSWAHRWNPLHDISNGRQLFYTQGVPHTDKDGNFRTTYDSTLSFFPKGIYNADPTGFRDIHDAGFNLAFLWQTYCPIDATIMKRLDETGNDLRTILYLVSPGGKPFIGRFTGKRDLPGITSATGAPFFYVDTNGDNKPDRQFSIGDPGDVAITGDWDGDRTDEFVLYRSSTKQLIFIDSIKDPTPYYTASDIPAAAQVISGNWDGVDGDGFGVYEHSKGKLALYQTYNDAQPFMSVRVDNADAIISGDWDGDGIDGYAAWNRTTSTFSFFQSPQSITAFQKIIKGENGDVPISGDWDNDNVDGYGMYRADSTHTTHALHLVKSVLSDETKVIKFGNPLIENSPTKYVYGVYAADEPGGRQNERKPIYKHLDAVYSSYASASPQVLFHTNIPFPRNGDTDDREWWKKFAVLGEATVHDDYPVCNTAAAELKSIESIAFTIEKSRTLNGETKPNWYVAQGFEKRSGKRFRFYLPEPQQYSAMIYTSLVHGSTGVFTFSYDNALFPEIDGISATKHTGLWKQTEIVNRQLDILKPFLLAPTSVSRYAIYAHQNPVNGSPVRTLLKYYNGYYLLLAVNITNQPLDITFQIPADLIPDSGDWYDMIGNESGKFRSGSVNAAFGPFGVHAFKFKMPLIADGPKYGYHQMRQVWDRESPRTSVYPNPADQYVVFEVNDEQIRYVTVEIFDNKGQLIQTLTQKADYAGVSRVTWNGIRFSGERIPSGLYFYKMTYDNISIRSGTFVLRW
jgi:hypothetical protein